MSSEIDALARLLLTCDKCRSLKLVTSEYWTCLRCQGRLLGEGTLRHRVAESVPYDGTPDRYRFNKITKTKELIREGRDAQLDRLMAGLRSRCGAGRAPSVDWSWVASKTKKAGYDRCWVELVEPWRAIWGPWISGGQSVPVLANRLMGRAGKLRSPAAPTGGCGLVFADPTGAICELLRKHDYREAK